MKPCKKEDCKWFREIPEDPNKTRMTNVNGVYQVYKPLWYQRCLSCVHFDRKGNYYEKSE